MNSLTYQELFDLLISLDFEEQSPNRFERLFLHPTTETMLAFSLLEEKSENQTVRPADMLSAETKLQHQGIISGSLKQAVQQARKG